MKYAKAFFVVYVVCSILGFHSCAYAQTGEERIEELKKQIEELQNQALQYRDNIAGERAKADSLKKEISILKNQISALETQITATSKNIDKTEIEITGLEETIYSTQEKIHKQKATIGRIILFFNGQDKESLLVQLFKNKNLSDFIRQQDYATTMSAQLLTIIDELRATEQALEHDKTTLEDKKEDLEALKQEHQAKRQSLAGATQVKNTILTQTKGQEAQYQKMLTEIEKKEATFFKELRALETSIVAGGLYLVHIQATGTPKKGTKLFSKPMDGAYITQSYGMTTYARRGAYGGAPHNGVDYAAGYGSSIKAIGDGEIIANGSNDGWGNWVAIRHPNQFNLVSLYSHMSALSPLKVGTQVAVGQVIGYEGKTGHVTGSHLHLSIYKDFFTYIHDTKSQLYFNYFEGSLNPLDYL
jgi:murein DD-endopeptidase MepM/ murein hydrolase activator NlpD